MSQEHVEVVRSICADWELGDFSRADWAHPEIEYVIADGPLAGRSTGVQGMADGARGIFNVWDRVRMVVDEFRELSAERVLVLTHMSGRGKTSGVDLGQMRPEGAFIFDVHDGKVTRHVVYWDRHRALADLGLTE